MRRSTTSLFVILIALVGLLSACSDGGSDDSSTTSEPTAPDTTALREVLPTAEDIDEAYTVLVVSSSDDPRPIQNAAMGFVAGCPAIEAVGIGTTGLNPDEAVIVFTTADRREVTVGLDPTVTDLAEEQIEPLVEAINECGTLTTDDPTTGEPTDLVMSAEVSDTYGDYGMSVSVDSAFELFEVPLTLQLRGEVFGVNGVGVAVFAVSGFEENADGAVTPVPVDEDVLAEVATLVEERVTEFTS